MPGSKAREKWPSILQVRLKPLPPLGHAHAVIVIHGMGNMARTCTTIFTSMLGRDSHVGNYFGARCSIVVLPVVCHFCLQSHFQAALRRALSVRYFNLGAAGSMMEASIAPCTFFFPGPQQQGCTHAFNSLNQAELSVNPLLLRVPSAAWKRVAQLSVSSFGHSIALRKAYDMHVHDCRRTSKMTDVSRSSSHASFPAHMQLQSSLESRQARSCASAQDGPRTTAGCNTREWPPVA